MRSDLDSSSCDRIRLGDHTHSPDSLVIDDQFRTEVRRLSELDPVRALLAVAGDWITIAICFVVAATWSHPVVWIVSALVIATRQHALLIIMHDASHYRFLSARSWNDRVSNWLLAWPLLVSTEGYRENHLAHHLHLNTDDDPDWTRKQGNEDWIFPKTRWGLARVLVRDLVGGGLLDQYRAIRNLSGTRSQQTDRRSARRERLAYYATAAALVTFLNAWTHVLVLWFLPAFTVLPVILRIRSIAEHFGVEGDHLLTMSRNFSGPVWERLLLAPHQVAYHLDHHLFPSVPFYNLPQLHRELCRFSEYSGKAHQNRSLFGLPSSHSATVLEDVCPEVISRMKKDG